MCSLAGSTLVAVMVHSNLHYVICQIILLLDAICADMFIFWFTATMAMHNGGKLVPLLTQAGALSSSA